MTYTYADLEISQTAFDEIKLKLANTGYLSAFESGGLDMNGIRLSRALMPVIWDEPNPNPLPEGMDPTARPDRYKDIP